MYTKEWFRIVLLIIPYIIVVGSFQAVGSIISGVDFDEIHAPKTTWQYLIISFFDLIGTSLILYIFTKYIDRESFINMGFHIKKHTKDIVLGVILGLAIMGSGYVILAWLDEIRFKALNYDASQILMSIGVFIIVAIVEEALFRGYVLRNLMYSFKKYIALIISSALFSIMHGANPNMNWFSFLGLFLAGILLGASYIYTKNLWFPIALHFSWNFFQTIFGFNVSGQDFYSLIEFSVTENNLLNGSAFGFEGSVLSIIAQVMLICGIFYYYSRKPISSRIHR